MTDHTLDIDVRKLVRSVPANPGWWATYSDDEGIWYSAIALWGEYHTGHYTVHYGPEDENGHRKIQSTSYIRWDTIPHDDDEELQVTVLAMAAGGGESEVDAMDGASNFLGYVYDPDRRRAGIGPKEPE